MLRLGDDAMSQRLRLVARLTLERWALTTRLRLGLWRIRAQIGWGLLRIAGTRLHIRWLIWRGKLPPHTLDGLDRQGRYLRALEKRREKRNSDGQAR